MIGTSQNTIQQNLGVGGTIAGAIGAQTAGNAANLRAQYGAQGTLSSGQVPWVVVGIALLYLIWSVVIQHQRIREQLQPSNIAANVHNFLVIGIAATIFLVLGKILFTKLTAWGVPFASAISKTLMAA